MALADDAEPDVKLQVAIAARKIDGLAPLPLLVKILATSGEDKLIPHIVWQNLHPLLDSQSGDFMTLVKQYDLKQSPNLAKIIPRVIEKISSAKKG